MTKDIIIKLHKIKRFQFDLYCISVSIKLLYLSVTEILKVLYLYFI